MHLMSMKTAQHYKMQGDEVICSISRRLTCGNMQRKDVEQSSTRGKKKVLSREFVCRELKNNGDPCLASFRLERELKKHIRTCHRFVRCGVCDQTRTFDSYKYSHTRRNRACTEKLPKACNSAGGFPANWSLPADFLEQFKMKKRSNASELGYPQSTEEGADEHIEEFSSCSTTPTDRRFPREPVAGVTESNKSELTSNVGKLVTGLEMPKSTGTRGAPNAEDGDAKCSDQSTDFSLSDITTIPTTPADDGEDSNVPSIESYETEESETPSSSPQHLLLADTTVIRRGNAQKRSRSSEPESAEVSPPHKKRVDETRSLLRYSGSHRRRFKGTPSQADEREVLTQVANVESNTEDLHDGNSSSDSSDKSAEKTNGTGGGQNAWLDSILKATFRETTMNLTFKTRKAVVSNNSLVSTVESAHQYQVHVNSGVLQLWHVLDNGISIEGNTLCLPHGLSDVTIFHQTLQFLHSGLGFLESNTLLQFLNGHAANIIHAFAAGLLVLVSVETMPNEQLLKVCSNIEGVSDPTLKTLTKLCCTWKLLRSMNDGDGLPEVSAALTKVIDPSATANRDVNADIFNHLSIMEAGIKAKGLPRQLHLECTVGQVGTVLQDFFFERLLKSFLQDGGSSVLLHVFKLNCDSFNKACGTAFVINVTFGDNVLPRMFYIHSIVLTARLGQQAANCPQHFKLIEELLREKTFSNSCVELFWKFLHSQEREEGWDLRHDLMQLVELSKIFKIPSIPWFLYAEEKVNSASLMRKFMSVYDYANDNVGISNLTRHLLREPELSLDLPKEMLFKVLMRDDLIVEEISVYELVVKISTLGCSLDPETVDVPVTVAERFKEFRKVVRFGIMSLKDFDEKVYDDPFLDPGEVAAFRHNIYCLAKGKLTRCIKMSEEFHKPYHRRFSQ